MPQTISAGRRNGTVDCFRLVAACSIIFLHFYFPGQWGSLGSCIGRFAVPWFFAISGYYSYQADMNRAKQGVIHVFNLLLLTLLLNAVLNSLYTYFTSGADAMGSYILSNLSLRSFARLIFLSLPPFGGFFPTGPLWFLAAMLTSHIFFYVYTKLEGGRNYWPFYHAATAAFLIQQAMILIISDSQTTGGYFSSGLPQRTVFRIPHVCLGTVPAAI